MWKETGKPYGWEARLRYPPDVRPATVIGTGFPCSPCGENRNKSSTRYPQEGARFGSVHILEKLRSGAHMWGRRLGEIPYLDWTSPQ